MEKSWIEQANECGHIFFDTYLHRECEFIGVHEEPPWFQKEVEEEDDREAD